MVDAKCNLKKCTPTALSEICRDDLLWYPDSEHIHARKRVESAVAELFWSQLVVITSSNTAKNHGREKLCLEIPHTHDHYPIRRTLIDGAQLADFIDHVFPALVYVNVVTRRWSRSDQMLVKGFNSRTECHRSSRLRPRFHCHLVHLRKRAQLMSTIHGITSTESLVFFFGDLSYML